jgi:2-dehydro-3-deoxyphosphooctonate aldolase (KDO 8-P synthase)
MTHRVKVGDFSIGGRSPLAFIAGPCVIENRRACIDLASKLSKMAKEEGVHFIFKASYDKANRSSHQSFRGPGLEMGLEILREVKERYGVPVLTDVHKEEEVEAAAAVVDVLQIPAFLCRQTDLLVAAALTGKPVNVKKGQFLAPWDMKNVVEKMVAAGNHGILLTERGASFGYNNLVVDMRSLLVMREFGYPVIFDATHSVQRPGAGGTSSSGDGKWAPALARAAVAAGCDAVFMETYVNPEKALSDKDNALPLKEVRELWRVLGRLHELSRA